MEVEIVDKLCFTESCASNTNAPMVVLYSLLNIGGKNDGDTQIIKNNNMRRREIFLWALFFQKGLTSTTPNFLLLR